MVYRLIFSRFPTLRNTVYFTSFTGLYNDNPLAISKQLHNLNPKIKIYWLIQDKSKEKENIPKYIHVIKKLGIKNALISSLAKVVVDNGVGQVYVFINKNKAWAYKLLKNKRQYDISTWHGTPIKKIGFDCYKNSTDLQFVSTCDAIVLGNEYTKQKISSNFSDSIPIALLGTPRNDVLVKSKNINLKEIKKSLGLTGNKKIVLFAPTFRDDIYKSNQKYSFDYLMNLDVDRVIRALSEKFGGEWIFVFRGHQFVDSYINRNKPSNAVNKIYDGNMRDDMTDYLLACDALITDYSSSVFDFAITKKPCFLYCPDLEHYSKEERGIYDVMFDTPYSISENNDDLIKNIHNFKFDNFDYSIDLFCEKYGYRESGNSSVKTANIINDIIHTKGKVNINNIIKEYEGNIVDSKKCN